MAKRYWLMKCEPSAYTIDDLERDGRTPWEGVRNYQARNFMRDDMHVDDGVLFYASNADPSGVTGVAEIVRAGYPDQFSWRKGHKYFVDGSTKANPVWYMVDIGFVARFPEVVPLETLKRTKGLESMAVTQKGSRLSVQPVTRREFEIVRRLGHTRRTASKDDILRFPSAVKHDRAIDAWLDAQRDECGPLVAWFARLRQCGGDVRELMHDGCPTACVHDAAFGYVAAFRDHVNVGFFFGASLPDPAGLLEGTGKRGRHVKLWPGRAVDSAALARLIEAAYADVRRR